jgi:hypothetical protein
MTGDTDSVYGGLLVDDAHWAFGAGLEGGYDDPLAGGWGPPGGAPGASSGNCSYY